MGVCCSFFTAALAAALAAVLKAAGFFGEAFLVLAIASSGWPPLLGCLKKLVLEQNCLGSNNMFPKLNFVINTISQ